ncbi:hypothetical protein B0J13DRAFT_322587 [Dactylonectria estremocensis]|uniref:Uncharacterized protein n=1 Tax=Dactylonectria estremocensis TaxID=1079267 RepID=A0A9P9EUP3_9HYPO|nr:hypothetical protein B0J13DRAFT_322587 [Dactylonectria estremocensis]
MLFSQTRHASIFFFNTDNMRTLPFICALAAKASAEELLSLDVPQGDWNCSTVTIALTTNATALSGYVVMLAKGWVGAAIRERYAFDGQIETNALGIAIILIISTSIDELVAADMQGYLDDDDDRLDATNETVQDGLANTDDPGCDPSQTLDALCWGSWIENYDIQKVGTRCGAHYFELHICPLGFFNQICPGSYQKFVES